MGSGQSRADSPVWVHQGPSQRKWCLRWGQEDEQGYAGHRTGRGSWQSHGRSKGWEDRGSKRAQQSVSLKIQKQSRPEAAHGQSHLTRREPGLERATGLPGSARGQR